MNKSEISNLICEELTVLSEDAGYYVESSLEDVTNFIQDKILLNKPDQDGVFTVVLRNVKRNTSHIDVVNGVDPDDAVDSMLKTFRFDHGISEDEFIPIAVFKGECNLLERY